MVLVSRLQRDIRRQVSGAFSQAAASSEEIIVLRCVPRGCASVGACVVPLIDDAGFFAKSSKSLLAVCFRARTHQGTGSGSGVGNSLSVPARRG